MKKSVIDSIIKEFNEEKKKITNINDEICCGMPLKEDEQYLACSICGKITLICASMKIESLPFECRILKQTYKRVTHFKKIIYNLQAREIFNMKKFGIIKQYLIDNNITDYNTDSIKNCLRDMNLSSYYLHIQLIRKHLGVEIDLLTDTVINRLISLFQQVEYLLKDKNFPNYHFILKQLFIFLKEYRFIHLLKTLKSEPKMIKEFKYIFNQLV
jgi:hypothetical protein